MADPGKAQQARAQALRDSLNAHSVAYHVYDNPIISDADYDALFHQLCQLEAQYHPEYCRAEFVPARAAPAGSIQMSG